MLKENYFDYAAFYLLFFIALNLILVGPFGTGKTKTVKDVRVQSLRKHFYLLFYNIFI